MRFTYLKIEFNLAILSLAFIFYVNQCMYYYTKITFEKYIGNLKYQGKTINKRPRQIKSISYLSHHLHSRFEHTHDTYTIYDTVSPHHHPLFQLLENPLTIQKETVFLTKRKRRRRHPPHIHISRVCVCCCRFV